MGTYCKMLWQPFDTLPFTLVLTVEPLWVELVP